MTQFIINKVHLYSSIFHVVFWRILLTTHNVVFWRILLTTHNVFPPTEGKYLRKIVLQFQTWIVRALKYKSSQNMLQQVLYNF